MRGWAMTTKLDVDLKVVCLGEEKNLRNYLMCV